MLTANFYGCQDSVMAESLEKGAATEKEKEMARGLDTAMQGQTQLWAALASFKV